MTGNNGHDDFQPLLYSFFKSIDTFRSSMSEYEQKTAQTPNGYGLNDIIKEFYENNNAPLDGLIDKFVPERYRLYAKGFKNLPWPQAVDLISTILKGYGENKTTEEVLMGLIGQKVREKGEAFRDSVGERIRETFSHR